MMLTKNNVLELYNECLNFLETNYPSYYLMVKPYKFGFGAKKRSFGTCYYRTKEIKIHMYLSQHMKIEQVKDTILHEMAHVIDKEKNGYSSGHGKNWKSICYEIGCNDKSSSKSVEDTIMKSNYVMVLVKNNGYEYVQPIHRLTKNKQLDTILQHVYLTGRKSETINKLKVVTFNDFENHQLPIDK